MSNSQEIKIKSGSEYLSVLDNRYRAFCTDKEIRGYPESSILKLSLSIGRDIDGDRVNVATISAAIKELTSRSLIRRAKQTGKYIYPHNESENKAGFRKMFESLAYENGSLISFDDFNVKVQKLYYGFVFTAHPTFSMSRDTTRKVAELATCEDETQKYILESELSKESQNRPEKITLAEEVDFSLEAVTNLRNDISEMYEVLFEAVYELYPDKVKDLRPLLCNVATWVGFDLDGRNDIGWMTIIANRLMLQEKGLERYKAVISEIISEDESAKDFLSPAIHKIDRAVVSLRSHHDFFIDYDPSLDDSHKKLQNASRDLVASKDVRMDCPHELLDIIGKAIQKCENKKSLLKLLSLRSEIENFGLSISHVHFRINAEQLHNAVRKHVDLHSHPADPRYRQTYIDKLMEKYRNDGKLNTHFGNILEEEASALRLMMVIQRIVKHIDSYSPVRFLIAETESSFTSLAALYYAKRLGIEDIIDICPLFETERALERAGYIVKHLIEVPEFRNYIKKRKRICFQTGYSDAGRYVGQPAAAGMIERLKERIADIIHDNNLHEVSMLFFDTHGESTGRGGHPQCMKSRISYVAPPAFLSSLRKRGLSCIQESSFQGGDGYVYFMTRKSGFSTLARVMEYWLSENYKTEEISDIYYEDRAGIDEFLAVVKAFQANMMKSSDYGMLLSSFGVQMLKSCGSRATKRQYDYGKTEVREVFAKEYRAIPHNAILAQNGMLASSFSGLGEAISGNPKYFDAMTEKSERFRNLMALPEYAASKSDPAIMKAYIDTLDPTLWLILEAQEQDPSRANIFTEIAEVLEQNIVFTEINRIFRKLFKDFTSYKKFLEKQNKRLISTSCDPEDFDLELVCLHAIRICLIHRIFMLAIEIPRYSPQHDISRKQLLYYLFKLEVPMVDKMLREIFPVGNEDADCVDYGEDSDYGEYERKTYAYETTHIFDPIVEIYEMIRDVSDAVIHNVGFTG